jgi:hypothetical protein
MKSNVWSVLQKDLSSPTGAGLAIWYGEEIILYRCRGHRVIETIDLHPFITFYIGDFPPIKFNRLNKIIGYINEKSWGPDNSSKEPIDFTKTNINEVYRYLNYDIYEIFRIIRKRGINSTNMERYPPNIGVQINLSSYIPRIEEPIRHLSETQVKINGTKYVLKPGYNDFS